MSTLPGFHPSCFQNKSNVSDITDSCAPYVLPLEGVLGTSGEISREISSRERKKENVQSLFVQL